MRLPILGIVAMSGALRAQAAPDTLIITDQIAPHVYLFRAPYALDKWVGSSNSVLIVNDDEAVVFDSHTRPITARRVIEKIRAITNKPVRTLINSHWHQDHWQGNDEFAKAFPGIRIIATRETRDYMEAMSGKYFFEQIGANRQRAALDSAIQRGTLNDGRTLTPALRAEREAAVADREAFAAEVRALPRVLPNMVYRDTMAFWSGNREFRLISAWGDATGSTVLYLPADRILVMGDVLVSPSRGDGPPTWTTNSYAIAPWARTLRGLAGLDAAVVVPGQGPAVRDKSYLELTARLFESIVAQVRGALKAGASNYAEVRKLVNVDALGARYPGGRTEPGSSFQLLVDALVRKAHQEALDGAQRLEP